ncbi:Sugar phosphate permease [Anaerobranca californiensis DSM 14826]|jgi:MFS family permease|uniref:Sugar phosphate permease n=1 Tax=Anaerobranca californiensis DSM 14826 TaxID=1120989 RepID=A0A1M6Q2C9_9FIRM|nr:MFS transporter [Anaerobranca californiensis]SHK14353.1 Sugar phosphate permease [Anaerobranca californiensis DSM 14826]
MYYGWIIVVIAALGLFFSGPGQTYSVSVFINSYIEEFSWSRAYISSLYSTATLFAGLSLSFVGRLVDKKGHRRMMSIVSFLLAIACFWMAAVSAPWMLFIGFFLVRLLGQGSMTLLSTTLVPQWFIEKRGKALSLTALGGVISSGLLPPLNTWIIQNYNWRAGWIFWGIALIAVMFPIAVFLIRNKPEDLGLLPDNKKIAGLKSYNHHNLKDDQVVLEEQKGVLETDWSLKEAMATKAFWLLLFCVTIPAALNTGFTFHLASIMEYRGFPSEGAAMLAASILSIYALVQFPSNMLAGVIADKYKTHLLLALIFIGFLIINITFLLTSNYLTAIFLGCIWGMVNGFFSIANGIVWPSYFGRKNLGSIRGVAMTAMVIGSAFGPLPFGFAYDYFGGYREILLISTIFPILGSIAAYLSPKPVK